MAAGSQRKGNKKSKRMSRMRRRRRQVLFGLVFVCVCIIFAISYGVLYRYVSKFPADKICDNIYIGSVNVSGMTDKEAKEALKKHLEESMIYKYIMELDCPVIYTTNYDHMLEEYYKLKKRKLHKIVKLNHFNSDEHNYPRIMKFHGDTEDMESIVLTLSLIHI